MLIRFWVEGFRRFGERIGLDLTDKKNYRFGEECVRGDFLDKIVILGGNNQGKTAFGFAMSDIASVAGDFQKDIGQKDPECFLNKDVGADKATFHYELAKKGSVITYEYSKSAPDELVSEMLCIDRTVVFRYDLSKSPEVSFDPILFGSSEPPEPDGRRSMVLMMADRNRAPSESPIGAVRDFALNSLYYMAMWKMDVHIGKMDGNDNVERFIIERNLVQEFSRFLSEVCWVDTEFEVSEGRLYMKKKNGLVPLLYGASRGTMILCRLFCWIKRSGDRDALVYFDDIDDMFHHRTAENVIRYIITNNRSQCIFVTHNTGIVSNNFMRPDCCFIMDGGQLRSLASLTDKDIRRGHNLEKMLREGEFDRKIS